jgi:hypothetical protein
MTQRIRIRDVTVLSDDWYLLKKRSSISGVRMDAANSQRPMIGKRAVVLLINRKANAESDRQFRFPAFVNGLADGMLRLSLRRLARFILIPKAIRRKSRRSS